jgi:hypothetical protein
MISEQDRLNLKDGDIVSRKFRGTVTNYVITATTQSMKHFWVLDLQYGDDKFYEENHDLTEPKWSVVSIANNNN